MHDGKYKIAQYGQWDGYPSGQGVIALRFLRKMDRTKFVEALGRCRFITEEENKALWNECGANPNSDMVSMDVSNKFKARYPELHRDCGADVLGIVYGSQGEVLLQDIIGFAGDSLFCEWCYVVDLDKNTFEVFKGFNKRKPGKNARFNDLATMVLKNGYYAVKLMKTYPLDALPTEEEFLKQCKS
jgi:hypothetical protein